MDKKKVVFFFNIFEGQLDKKEWRIKAIAGVDDFEGVSRSWAYNVFCWRVHIAYNTFFLQLRLTLFLCSVVLSRVSHVETGDSVGAVGAALCGAACDL